MATEQHLPLAHAATAPPRLMPQSPAEALTLFVEGSVLGRAIHAVCGRDGIAFVPSPRAPERSTYLFWSHPGEAERWADVLVENPQVMAVDLPAFLSETLPALAGVGATVGIDWSSDPLEAEQEPAALGAHLREELARDFASTAARTRIVWMLADGSDIAGIKTPDGQRVTPVWADRFLAEAAATAIGDRGLSVVRKPLLELTSRYLLSSEGLKAEMAPGYVHAPGPVVMSPWALKALLHGAPRAHAQPRIAVVSG